MGYSCIFFNSEGISGVIEKKKKQKGEQDEKEDQKSNGQMGISSSGGSVIACGAGYASICGDGRQRGCRECRTGKSEKPVAPLYEGERWYGYNRLGLCVFRQLSPDGD